jgi:hypothetical protein
MIALDNKKLYIVINRLKIALNNILHYYTSIIK